MDGITPMGGILILNTNRPNDIDSAIKRPGRIDIQLTLNRMSSKHATDLIKHYGYDINNVKIPDRLLMGCIIANLCIFSKDSKDLENKLKLEIANQQQLIEKKKNEEIETKKIVDDIAKKTTEKHKHLTYPMNHYEYNLSHGIA